MADDLASTLAAWRSVVNAPEIPDAPKDWLVTELDAWFIATARNAFPRLLAAVEAVLKLTRDSAGNDRHRERVLTVGEVREAITRELTGKEAGDETTST
jgi:hypothetical protein